MTYQPPTAEQLRLFLWEHNITPTRAAKLLHTDRSKFRCYLLDEGRKNHRPCPFPVWYTLNALIANGEHKNGR